MNRIISKLERKNNDSLPIFFIANFLFHRNVLSAKFWFLWIKKEVQNEAVRLSDSEADGKEIVNFLKLLENRARCLL